MFNGTKVTGALAALLLGLASLGSTSAQASDSLTAKDQPLLADTVIVESVMASQDGWVVIHESNPDGTVKVPDIIGKAAVKAGETKNLNIKLDKKVETPAKLWPMLHIDAGTIGTYEFPGPDTPVTANGQVVMMEITVTVVGMPRTGQTFDITLLIIAALTGMSLLTLGLTARRRSFIR